MLFQDIARKIGKIVLFVRPGNDLGFFHHTEFEHEAQPRPLEGPIGR